MRNKIYARIVELGLKTPDVAKKLGLSTCAFSLKLNGHREFKLDEIKKLIVILGLKKSDVYSFFLE